LGKRKSDDVREIKAHNGASGREILLVGDGDSKRFQMVWMRLPDQIVGEGKIKEIKPEERKAMRRYF